jgi:hypothetical protein
MLEVAGDALFAGMKEFLEAISVRKSAAVAPSVVGSGI